MRRSTLFHSKIRRANFLKDAPVPLSEKSESSVSTTILERAKLGDHNAFKKIMNLYVRLVYYWCRRSNIQAADSEDVVQLVFAAASRGLPGFQRVKREQSFRAWLRVITRSKIADFYREQAKIACSIGGDSGWEKQIISETPENAELSLELVYVFEKVKAFVIGEFSSWHGRAFLMHMVDGMSVSEVAEEFGVEKNAIYILKSRILKRLRDEFGNIFE